MNDATVSRWEADEEVSAAAPGYLQLIFESLPTAGYD